MQYDLFALCPALHLYLRLVCIKTNVHGTKTKVHGTKTKVHFLYCVGTHKTQPTKRAYSLPHRNQPTNKPHHSPYTDCSNNQPRICTNYKMTDVASNKKAVAAVPSLEAFYEKLLSNGIVFSKPKEKKDKSGFTIYPQDSTVAGSPSPQFLFPRTKSPFKPGYGKFKTEINAFTCMNLELSIEDTPFGHFVVKVFQELDKQVRAAVAPHCRELFKRQLSEAELDFFHRKSIVPSSKSGAFPYLLRFKLHPSDVKQTKYFTVTGVNEKNQNTLRVSTVDDMAPFCEVMNSVEFGSVFVAPKMFGSMFPVRKCVQWPPVKRGRNTEADNDMTADDMGDFAVPVVTEAESEAGADAGAEASGASGTSGAGSGTTGADDDDAHSNKRARRSNNADDKEDEEEDGDEDGAYVNSDEEDE